MLSPLQPLLSRRNALPHQGALRDEAKTAARGDD